jgi:hypothetical protein
MMPDELGEDESGLGSAMIVIGDNACAVTEQPCAAAMPATPPATPPALDRIVPFTRVDLSCQSVQIAGNASRLLQRPTPTTRHRRAASHQVDNSEQEQREALRARTPGSLGVIGRVMPALQPAPCRFRGRSWRRGDRPIVFHEPKPYQTYANRFAGQLACVGLLARRPLGAHSLVAGSNVV